MNAAELELHATTDVVDEFFVAGRFLDQAHFDALMDYLAALGVKRLDWLYGYQWTIYPDYPGGFDLLAYAVKAAHARGLRFDVVLKPFEAAAIYTMPQTFPAPSPDNFWPSVRGHVTALEPFVVQHPEWCWKHRPSNVDGGGAIRSIRLVSLSDEATSLTAADLSIWTTDRVGGEFHRYETPFMFRNTLRLADYDYGFAAQHPQISAYNLYETANFTRSSAPGQFEGAGLDFGRARRQMPAPSKHSDQ